MRPAMRMVALAAGLGLLARAAIADVATPLDRPLPAGDISMIAAASLAGPSTSLLFHYRLYLPSDYHDDESRRYPVLFVAAPRGDAKMGQMTEALQRDRWIVVMLVESRNGSLSWYPNFVTAYDDVIRRARVLPEMAFCTGFSGSARACSAYPGIRGGFQGLILQAASFLRRPDYLRDANDHVSVYGIFGTADPNFREARAIRRGVPPNTRSMVEIWDGEHAWAPAAVFERALDWVVAKALVDAPYDPRRAEAYRWHLSNLLSRYQHAETSAERVVLAHQVAEAATRWHLKPDDRSDAALATVLDEATALADDPALKRELAARDAYQEVLARDEESRGSGLVELATAYQTIAEAYPATRYGRRAALRRRSVLWEAGREIR